MITVSITVEEDIIQPTGGGFMRSFLVAAVVASASISGAAQAAENSYGSGVVVGDHGEVLTNAHVVNACAQIFVRSPAGDSATAQLIFGPYQIFIGLKSGSSQSSSKLADKLGIR
jgi:S1-C subfamily serine protease